MTDGQTYYDGLIAQGYPADQALGYTQQYYPGFTPAAVAPAPMPVLETPTNVQDTAVGGNIHTGNVVNNYYNSPPQSVTQPQAIPQPQPMAQPMAQTIPMPQPMMNAAPLGMAPMGMVPIGEKKPIMAWAAVGCLAVALLLAISIQFTNSWLVYPEEGVGVSWGLNSASIDCEDSNDDQACLYPYLMFRDGFDEGIDKEDGEYIYEFPEEDSISGSTKILCDNVAKSLLQDSTFWDEDGYPRPEIQAAAEDAKQECLDLNGAGNTGGLVIWLGALGALAGTLMLIMSQLGKTLPSNAERYGKLTSWVSGGLIILGAIIWMIMKPTDSGLDDYDTGLSFYLAIIAGVLAITAGVLDMLDKRE